MDQQKFLNYIDHFNHKRYDEVMAYYDPEVVIEYPTMLANPKASPVTRTGRAGFLQQSVTLRQPAAKLWKSAIFCWIETWWPRKCTASSTSSRTIPIFPDDP